MLFRSTCSWLFSVDNPLRVATEALNIHLVSCILYLVVTWVKSLLDSAVTMQAHLESLVGTMVSVVPACPLVPMHYRALQRVLLGSLRSGMDKSKLSGLGLWLESMAPRLGTDMTPPSHGLQGMEQS